MTELALSEAVPLAHALLDRLALESGVRVLFIKGPTAVAQGLRAPRESLDVDALVDPARRDHLAERLAELGWVDEHPYTSPTVLPMHSTTHRHDRWPNELDLHDRFPGFFADAQDVFERLWERRKTVNVAAHDIACPDPAGQALVLALHTLRDPHDPSKAHELASLVERVSATATADSLRDLAELARDLGAADTAAPFLDRVGAPAVGRGSTDPADLRAWELRTQPDATTASPGSTSSGSSRGDDAPATSGTPRSSVTSSCGWRSRTCPRAAGPCSTRGYADCGAASARFRPPRGACDGSSGNDDRKVAARADHRLPDRWEPDLPGQNGSAKPRRGTTLKAGDAPPCRARLAPRRGTAGRSRTGMGWLSETRAWSPCSIPAWGRRTAATSSSATPS